MYEHISFFFLNIFDDFAKRKNQSIQKKEKLNLQSLEKKYIFV